jgi:outer membrane usher protein FimD/PapC
MSGFLVSAKGSANSDSTVRVLVDGAKRATVKINSTRFVPASEYDVHEVSFQVEGNKLVNVDGKIYRKTLYPGNVISIDVQAKEIQVAIGRLLNHDGSPLRNALLLDVEGIAISDDEGYFQAEVASDLERIRVKKGDTECAIPYESISLTGQVAYLGDQICH